MVARFPDPPASADGLQIWAADLVRALNAAFDSSSERVAGEFTVTTTATTRTLDASTATVADVANVLGTLIEDQQGR